jgi:hypothetical protein
MPFNRRKTPRAIAMGCVTLVLLHGTTLRKPAEAQGVPSDWVVYHRPGALVVPHPPGWQVREGGDGAFVVVRRAAGPLPDALVYVKPQRFGAARSAADALARLPHDEAALFPGARLLRAFALAPPTTVPSAR